MNLIHKAIRLVRQPSLGVRKLAKALRARGLLPAAMDPRTEALRFFGRNCIAERKVDLRRVKFFRSESFPRSGPVPWLDRPDAAQEIDQRLARGQITPAEAEICRHWSENGYVVFPGAVEAPLVDAAWSSVERALSDGTVTALDERAGPEDTYPGRCLNAHVKLPPVAAVLRHPAILQALALLMGRKPLPYQTIAFFKGSQQAEHGDSIHMTSYPLGYLIASWTACEDIHPDSGPLVYYPGSHKLPYVLSHEAGIPPGAFQAGGYLPTYTAKYEPLLQRVVRENGLQPRFFEPRKGDVFLWHANLIHGGSSRKDLRLSRKSIVSHYFFEGTICYHDLAGELIDLRQILTG